MYVCSVELYSALAKLITWFSAPSVNVIFKYMLFRWLQ
jgi:hypothetical protein